MKKGHTYMRSDAMNEKLSHWKSDGCVLCKSKQSEVFKYWDFRVNDFPYDVIASKHDMLFLKRHAKFPNDDEKQELGTILRTIRHFNEYEAQLESLDEKASIPDHYHVHLITFKRH